MEVIDDVINQQQTHQLLLIPSSTVMHRKTIDRYQNHCPLCVSTIIWNELDKNLRSIIYEKICITNRKELDSFIQSYARAGDIMQARTTGDTDAIPDTLFGDL